MRWFFFLPPSHVGAYLVYWAICVVYTAAFTVGSSLPAHRRRIHRGSWAHVVEGWAFVAVVWTALAWSHYYLTVHSWPHLSTPGSPVLLHAAAIAIWVLRPLAVLAPVLMVVTTLIHALAPADGAVDPSAPLVSPPHPRQT